MAPGAPERVVLHPLVLLSVVDHYNRVARDTRKRVVGVLLGEPVGDGGAGDVGPEVLQRRRPVAGGLDVHAPVLGPDM